jgi:ComF family protein
LLLFPGTCRDCQQEAPPFSWSRAAGLYEGRLRRAIQEFKYSGRRRLAISLAYLLYLALEEAPERPTFDAVVPVPLHPRRQAQRSFNQAALLARELAHHLGLPCPERALIRTRDTPPQVGLGRAERLSNLAGAFAVPDARVVAGRTLLLVDDTFTTGATVSACSRALLTAGAAGVCAVTVATALALS